MENLSEYINYYLISTALYTALYYLVAARLVTFSALHILNPIKVFLYFPTNEYYSGILPVGMNTKNY